VSGGAGKKILDAVTPLHSAEIRHAFKTITLIKANGRDSHAGLAPVLMLVNVLTPSTSKGGKIHLPPGCSENIL
jgi:hypothetical protein